ncbi:alpha/beta fold hydrolase [Streptacidiphilus sp. PAMC 29251]
MSTTPRASADLDAQLRAGEQALFDRYELKHTERQVVLKDPAVQVRLLEFGTDTSRPPVLLLHGIASVTALAAPLLPYLTGNRRVIAVDWPGHGLSGPLKLRRDAVVRNHATAVLTGLLDALELETVDLVGHSMGGQFSLYFTLDAPERVRRLVLLGAPGAGLAEVRPAPVMRVAAVPGLGRAMLRVPLPEAVYVKNNEALIGAGALEAYPDEIGRIGYLAARRPGFARSVASFFRAFITPWGVRAAVPVSHAELATLSRPTLLLWGDQDLFLTPATARPSLDALPEQATVIQVPGGHAPWLDALETCGNEAARFLDTD